MKIAIECGYTVTATHTFELPEGKTWDDVSDYFVKWGQLFIAFNDGDYAEIGKEGDLSPDSMDTVNYKRPDYTNVYAVETDDGHDITDYEQRLSERE